MPRWVTGSDLYGLGQNLLKLLRRKDHIRTRVETTRIIRANPSFLEDLNRCNDVTSLHDWATVYEVELQRYSRLAFRQLCKSKASLQILLIALEDSALNNPANLDFLLRQQKRQALPSDDVEIFGQWFKKTFCLGQQSGVQISLIMDFVLHMSTVNKDEQLKCGLGASIFEGVESSTIFGVKDLEYYSIGTLLKAVTNGTFSQKSQDLGFQIINAIQPSQAKHLIYSISLFIKTAVTTQASTQAYADIDGQQLHVIQRLSGMLQALPQPASCAIVLVTCKALINHTTWLIEYNVPFLNQLDQWWAWIRQSDFAKTIEQAANKRSLERSLAGRPLAVVAAYLRPLDDYAIAHFIFRRELRDHLDLANQRRALDLFKGLCQNEKVSPYESMMRAAHAFSTIPEKVMQRVFTLLQMLQKSGSIVDIVAGLRTANHRVSEHIVLHTIRTGQYCKSQKVESLFKVYRELPLEKCTRLAERMINNLRRHPLEALRLYAARHPITIPGCRERSGTIKARARLLQRMALAYSTASHLTPRMAFRNVYRCYFYHMREGLGHLSGMVVRALVRSGIVRPLDRGQWVSTMRVRWILKLVRRFEGPEIEEKVDRAIHQWRGMVVKRIQDDYHLRKRLRHGGKEEPMSFRFRSKWNRRQGYVDRIMEPLKDKECQI